MNKIIITLLFVLCSNLVNTTYVICDTILEHKQHTQNNREAKRLKDELFELENQIFYTKHLSPVKIFRERVAFLVAAAGLAGSFIIPFKLVKSSPTHPYRALAKRLKVAGATLAASATGACALTYIRPVLWLKETKKKQLDHKIFELQNVSKKT